MDGLGNKSGAEAAPRRMAAGELGARPLRYFDFVMAAFVTILLLSNVIGAAKPTYVTLFGEQWVYGAGILFFPIGYVIGDVLTEVYGYARARRVIHICLVGGLSHLDSFDYKPELVKRTDEPCPDEYYEGKRFAFTSGRPLLLGTPQKFRQHGDSGQWMSEALPQLAKIADDLTIVKSMNTEQFNHAPAQLLIYTGSPRSGRPSMGAWTAYGLGSENKNLPGFVVLISGGVAPSGGADNWGSGFLPSVYQGVQCRSKGDPVLYVSNPKGIDRNMRRISLDALRDLNHMQTGT